MKLHNFEKKFELLIQNIQEKVSLDYGERLELGSEYYISFEVITLGVSNFVIYTKTGDEHQEIARISKHYNMYATPVTTSYSVLWYNKDNIEDFLVSIESKVVECIISHLLAKENEDAKLTCMANKVLDQLEVLK